MPYSRELIVARLAIGILRSISSSFLDVERFGTHAGDAVLLCAIFVGQAESKPMTAAKLAGYAGIPRPTVARKLKQFEQCGVVRILSRGQVVLTADILGESIRSSMDLNVRLINRAAAELSKMDTSRIAHRKGT